jgi:hypothetical protein
MPWDGIEAAMSQRELIAREVNRLREPDLDKKADRPPQGSLAELMR